MSRASQSALQINDLYLYQNNVLSNLTLNFLLPGRNSYEAAAGGRMKETSRSVLCISLMNLCAIFSTDIPK